MKVMKQRKAEGYLYTKKILLNHFYFNSTVRLTCVVKKSPAFKKGSIVRKRFATKVGREVYPLNTEKITIRSNKLISSINFTQYRESTNKLSGHGLSIGSKKLRQASE